MPKIIKTETATTTDDYTTLILIQVPDVNKLLITIRENNVNDVMFKIEGSDNADFFDIVPLKAETTITKGTSAPIETLTDPYLFIRVLHKAASSGNQGETTVKVVGS